MTGSTVSDTDIERAIEAGLAQRTRERWAAEAFYDPEHDRIELRTGTGWGFVIDRANIKEFERIAPSEMTQMRLSPAGTALHLDGHNVHVSVDGLLASLRPFSLFSKLLARRGGMAKSRAKKQASRRNGAKGGRPRKQKQYAD